MADAFDPYYKWLGIPPEEQPPNHYRLLAIGLFEDDADVIEAAANRQLAHLRTYQNGKHAAHSQRLLNEVSQARTCLLSQQQRTAYDQKLRKQTAQKGGGGTAGRRKTGWRDGQPPKTIEDLQFCLSAVGLMSPEECAAFIEQLPDTVRPKDAHGLLAELSIAGKLTRYQTVALQQGKLKFLQFGEYLIVDRIGKGGMGQVLKAEHRRMRRVVALKVLSSATMKNPDAIRRFQREVQAAARLIHPNIVTAFDANEADGIHFLVMEYVDGKDLSTVLRIDGPLPVEKAADCMLQAARGLAFAHESGIVHRDIKPANLLLDKRGAVKILDMGLARVEQAETNSQELTNSGQVMGTIDYMAPEQALDTKTAGPRADIYSLGCTFYKLLTNELLYQEDTLIKKILAHREAPIPSLRSLRPDVPPALEAIVRRMVAKRAEDRYQSMNDLVADLEAFRGATSAQAASESRLGSGDSRKGSAALRGEGPRSENVLEDSKLGNFLAGLDSNKSGRLAPAGPPAVVASGSGSSISGVEETLTNVGQATEHTADKLAAMLPPQPARPARAQAPAKSGKRAVLIGSIAMTGITLLGLVALAIFLFGFGNKPIVDKGKSPKGTGTTVAIPGSSGEAKTKTPTTVPPATGPRPSDLPPQQWADLLALVDPMKDAVAGNWALEDGRLRLRFSLAKQRIEFPLTISGNYHFRLRFSGSAEGDSRVVVLPVGNRATVLSLDALPDRVSQLRLKNIVDSANPTRVTNLRTTEGAIYCLDVDVETVGAETKITATVDDAPLLSWQGPAQSLDAGPWSLVQVGTIGLGGWTEGRTIHEASVQLKSGQAMLLRPAPAGVNWKSASPPAFSKTAVDTLFFGDDFISNFTMNGRSVWDAWFGVRGVNKAQSDLLPADLIHRLHQGHLDILDPQVVVLSAGFRDLHRARASPPAASALVGEIRKVLSKVQARFPAANILLLDVFSWEDSAAINFHARAKEINAELAKLADGESIVWCPVSDKLLEADGTRVASLWASDTALSLEGYRLWAAEIDARLPALLGPPATVPPTPSVPIDLLTAKPATDVVHGTWQPVGTTLLTHVSASERVRNRMYLSPAQFPLPEEYDLHLTIQRMAETGSELAIGLVSSGQPLAVRLIHEEGFLRAGLELIDGQTAEENSTLKNVQAWPLNEQLAVMVQVRRAGIRATCEGTEAVRWIGKPAQLSSGSWSMPDPLRLFLGSNLSCTIHSAVLTTPGGPSTVSATPSPAAPLPVPAAPEKAVPETTPPEAQVPPEAASPPQAPPPQESAPARRCPT